MHQGHVYAPIRLAVDDLARTSRPSIRGSFWCHSAESGYRNMLFCFLFLTTYVNPRLLVCSMKKGFHPDQLMDYRVEKQQ